MNNLVSVNNNQVVVSSKDVAKHFDKQHKNVLRDIREILVAQNCATKFFKEISYEYHGRKFPEFLINRDGFSLLAMGFTGKKALHWKIKYIEAFNQMEEKLKNGNGKEEPQRLIWKGQIVIRPIDLAAMIQVDVSRVRYVVKQFGLEQFFLIGNEMRLFRTQNNLPPSPSPRVLVYPEKTVRTLVQILKRASVALAQINKYFSPVHIPSAVKKDIRESIISINSPRVLKKLDTIRKNTILLEGMLNHFTTYKRTRAKHVSATELMTEVSANIMHDLHQLNQDISVSTLPEA